MEGVYFCFYKLCFLRVWVYYVFPDWLMYTSLVYVLARELLNSCILVKHFVSDDARAPNLFLVLSFP